MVRVVVTEDDEFDGRQVQAQHLEIALDRVFVGAGVEENAPAVDFDERCESPLAEAFVGQHGRQDLDLQARNEMAGSCGLRVSRAGCTGEDGEQTHGQQQASPIRDASKNSRVGITCGRRVSISHTRAAAGKGASDQ